MTALRGTFSVLTLYDVAEQIDLEKLREITRVIPARREPSFKHPAPEYVRFERAPVVQDLEPVRIGSGEPFLARAKYFHYGVISVELELPFTADWMSWCGSRAVLFPRRRSKNARWIWCADAWLARAARCCRLIHRG